jgi:hypothetical protein
MRPITLLTLLTLLSPLTARGLMNQEINGFRLIVQPKPTNQYVTCTATHAVASLDGTIFGLEGVKVEIREKDGKLVKSIVGQFGQLDMKTNEVVIDDKDFVSLKDLSTGKVMGEI